MTLSAPREVSYVTLRSRPQGLPDEADFQRQHKSLEELQIGDFVVKNTYFSVDASMRLRMNPTPSPYLPTYELNEPLDGWAVGEVIESRSDKFPVGASVLHYLGWRDYALLSDEDTGWVAPRLLDANSRVGIEEYLDILGPTGLTAWAGLRKVAELKPEDVVYVSAAAGAVGSLVTQIAARLGNKVVGSAGSADKVEHIVENLGATSAFSYREVNVLDGLQQVAPEGIDVYFDNVGGDHLDAALLHMNPGGRVALCGAIGTYNSPGESQGVVNLFSAIEKGLKLEGFLARMYEDSWPECIRELESLMASRPFSTTRTEITGLEQAPQAFIGLLTGQNVGKVLIKLES